MLVSDLKTALKRYGFNDDDPLLIWLNAAMHEVENFSSWLWLEEYEQFTYIAGTGPIAITTTYRVRKPISLRDVTHRCKLDLWDRTRFDRSISDPQANGSPQIYLLHGGVGGTSIDFWPTPLDSTTFSFAYQRGLDDLVQDTDEPLMPSDFHYPIVQKAASIALMAENEEERAGVAKNEFESAMELLSSSYRIRDLDEPQQVVDAMGYGDEYVR